MIDFSEVQRKITNRFSVEELEARLKPQKLEYKKGEWWDHSEGGFLAPDESLMEVVRADYDTLCSLGKSYQEMAQIAANVLGQASKEGYRGGNRVTEGIRNLVARYWKPAANIDRDKYALMPIGSAGSQTCPWECKSDEYGYSTSGSGQIYVLEKEKEGSDLMRRWLDGQMSILMNDGISREERDTQMREFEKSLGIEFGGTHRVSYLSAFTVITDLTPHLIASHYFFEGDASYRTDPRKLLQVVGME